MEDISIKFETFNGDTKQIKALYELLKARKHNISHQSLPSYEKHEEFAKNNPYRYWYLINYGGSIIGSLSVKFDNSIGLNIINNDLQSIKPIIEFINNKLTPIPATSSIIPSYFYINVAPKNVKLKKLLEQENLNVIQHSYKV